MLAAVRLRAGLLAFQGAAEAALPCVRQREEAVDLYEVGLVLEAPIVALRDQLLQASSST